MAQQGVGAPAQAGAFDGYGTPGYRSYVLTALVVVYTINFIDRVLVGVLNEPIKEAFGVSDAMMGWLGGPAFAILYTFLGIPIARLAERANRVTIISVATATWSAATAACGLAANYWQLLIARLFVSVGEAGCSPPAHSLIADYFPVNRRGTALSIYALGIPIGTMFAAVAGGWIAQEMDWRYAFFLLGLPGVIIAIVVKLTLREPPRNVPADGKTETPGLGEALRTLARKRTFWCIALGGAVSSFVGYGIGQFLSSYFIRTHGLGVRDAAMIFGVVGGLASVFGTFFGGWLADRVSSRTKKWFLWIPAIAFAIASPLYAIGLNIEDLWMAVTLLMIPAALNSIWLGPAFAMNQNLAPPRMRATASALLLFLLNIIGYGLGPPSVGYLSDFLMGRAFAEAGTGLAYAEACRGASAVASLADACAAARADGLLLALTLTVAIGYAVAALLFWFGSTRVEDEIDPSSR